MKIRIVVKQIEGWAEDLAGLDDLDAKTKDGSLMDNREKTERVVSSV